MPGDYPIRISVTKRSPERGPVIGGFSGAIVVQAGMCNGRRRDALWVGKS